MILATLALAGAVADSVQPAPIQWDSLNHSFVCSMHSAQGQPIRLEGAAKETVTEADGRVTTNGTFAFRSPDAAWKFISGSTKTSGGGLIGNHTLHFDNIDDPSKAGFKPVSLQLTFASRIDGISGPYGYALLQDQTIGVSRVKQGSDYPIIALGICVMTPKSGKNG